MALNRHLDIPTELAKCVKKLGGVLLDEDHGPNDPTKADYWFPTDGVIAELKLLSKNYFDDRSFKDWLQKRHEDWVRRGLAPAVYGTSLINLAVLPRECGWEVTSFLRKRLDAALKQASEQIKATRTNFKVEHALGLLILVNDGNIALPPSMVTSILARSLPSKFSGINSVVHFSANIRSELAGHDKDLLYWCSLGAKSKKPVVPAEFMERLRKTWMAHHAEILGEDVPVLMATSDEINNMKFVGPEGAI